MAITTGITVVHTASFLMEQDCAADRPFRPAADSRKLREQERHVVASAEQAKKRRAARVPHFVE